MNLLITIILILPICNWSIIKESNLIMEPEGSPSTWRLTDWGDDPPWINR